MAKVASLRWWKSYSELYCMEIFRVKRWIISALKNDKRYLLLTTTDYFMKVTNLACTNKCKFLIRLQWPRNRLWMSKFFINFCVKCSALDHLATSLLVNWTLRLERLLLVSFSAAKKDLNFSMKILYCQNLDKLWISSRMFTSECRPKN